MQDTIQWLRLQVCVTLTVTYTLRNCLFFTRAFIRIRSSCTLGIRDWWKSDVVCLWFVTNFRCSTYAVGRGLPVADWAAELRLPLRMYLFELSWWKSVHTIHYKIRVLAAQTYKFVKCSKVCIRCIVNWSLFKEVWYMSERLLPVICRIAEQKLSFEVHTLKLQHEYGAQTTEAILGSSKCMVRTYFLAKI